MKLRDVLSRITDSTNVSVFDANEDNQLGSYDGRDSISEVYNDCEVVAIWKNKHEICIDIDYVDENKELISIINNEALKIINLKIADIFKELQKKYEIRDGDISPDDEYDMFALEEMMAKLIAKVIIYEKNLKSLN